MNKKAKRKLSVKKILIIYNLITILKYLLIGKDILLIDFKIDFIYLNITLILSIISINKVNRVLDKICY